MVNRIVYPLTGTLFSILGAVTLFPTLRYVVDVQSLFKALDLLSFSAPRVSPLAQVCLGGSNSHAWAGIIYAVLAPPRTPRPHDCA